MRRFHDVALIHAENAYQLKDGRTGVSRYTDIWHKQEGRWLCVAAHINMYEAPGLWRTRERVQASVNTGMPE